MIGALDIGGTKIALGIVERSGRIALRADLPADPGLGFAESISRMISTFGQMIAQHSSRLEGIGIACTGPVDRQTGTLGQNAFLPNWSGKNICKPLKNAFHVEIAVENDADAAALGEYLWGTGKGSERLLCVMVGTGIGCGLVLDGKLYRGVESAHPEMGHHRIDPQGPLCFCGASGCWESLAGGRALETWFKEQTHRPGRSCDAREIYRLASKGDNLAKNAVERQTRYLSIGLANLVTLLTPDCMVLGGGMMAEYNTFIGHIRDVIHSSCGLVPGEKTRIVRSAFGADAGLIGAAAVWQVNAQA